MTRARETVDGHTPLADRPTLLAHDVTLTIAPSGRDPMEIFTGVDLEVAPGEVVGLVGESGSGKTMFARSVAGLLPDHLGATVSGSVRINERDVVAATSQDRRRVLRHDVSYIFQDPMAHLNPTMRIGRQVEEAAAPGEDVAELFRSVGLPGTTAFARRYPHTLSGGMRQRVLIACALAKRPSLLIADEPTTALDVTVQAQVIDLLHGLTRDRGVGVLLITHDLAVVSQNCDRIYVMYAGRIMEESDARTLLTAPAHPYTEALMAAVHDINLPDKQVRAIPGAVPSMDDLPVGCRFRPRCAHRDDGCDEEPPLLGDAGRYRCWYPRSMNSEAAT